MSLMIYALAA